MNCQIREEFLKASKAISSSATQHEFDAETKLRLYALYKHATLTQSEADSLLRQPAPSRLAEWGVKRAKWDAWINTRTELLLLLIMSVHSDDDYSQSQLDAMSAYTQLANSSLSLSSSSSSSKGTSSSRTTTTTSSAIHGPVMSRMVDDDQDNFKDTINPLFLACINNDIDALRELSKNTDMKQRDSKQRTLLHHASDRGHLECVKYLIESNTDDCDVNAQDEDMSTALHYACVCGHRDIIELLLANGADLNIQDCDGNTAQQVADDSVLDTIFT